MSAHKVPSPNGPPRETRPVPDREPQAHGVPAVAPVRRPQTFPVTAPPDLPPEVETRTPPPPLEQRESRRLEPGGVVPSVQPLADHLRRRVIGQDSAVDPLVRALQRSLAGLNDPSRPLLTALLLGPTGVGKTETAKALASGLLGSESALLRIDCEEYSHGFELSKLLGSPPGYIGFNVEPLLSQERLEEGHTRLHERVAKGEATAQEAAMADRLAGKGKLSILLFDEVEKASPKLWSALLGVLDDGRLTLGDNRTTDFTRSVILMTTNVGSRSIGDLLEAPRLGFDLGRGSERRNRDSDQVRDAALDAARQHFPAEFLNRFDEQLVYAPLGEDDLFGIFDRMLSDLQQRVLERSGVPFLLKVSDEARALLVDRGSDSRYGARPLRRVIETEIVGPLAEFIAAGTLEEGDVVEVLAEDGELGFVRGARASRAVVA